jgi:hypothetical protein
MKPVLRASRQCATDEDTYHASKDLCSVTDSVLIQWLNGDGQTYHPPPPPLSYPKQPHSNPKHLPFSDSDKVPESHEWSAPARCKGTSLIRNTHSHRMMVDA